MLHWRAVLFGWLALAASTSAAAAQDGPDSLLTQFYQRRGYRLAWIDSGGVSSQARRLLEMLARADREGLDPNDYDVATSDSSAWRLDSTLTRAFLFYGWDVSRGRVSPALVDSLWTAAPPPPSPPPPRATDLVRLLEWGIDSARVAGAMRDLAPTQPGYVALRRALALYRDIAARDGEGWPALPRATPPAALGRRLAAEGYDTAGGLDAAVRRFQEAHGLDTDGVVGPVTRAALNVPAAARARQIELNLERWRWLPRALGERYIVVNSAAFTLDLVDRGVTALTMRAIVGRPDWPTPITSSRVTDILFRPVWNVPRAIAVTELLPLLRRDSAYLSREGIRVFGDSAAGGQEIVADAIDWSGVTESTFAYQLAQEPGPDNPLGGVKLVFWTPFNVFIHDTPARPLFTERWRAFSHGCVRVEGAATLAAYLLPGWPVDSIEAAMTEGRERRVRLPAPIPVHLVYWTAWVGEDGLARFREDSYGWDALLGAALRSRRPLVSNPSSSRSHASLTSPQ